MINNFLQFITKLISTIHIVFSLFACSSNDNQTAVKPAYNQYQQQPAQYAPPPVRQDGYYYTPGQQPAYNSSPYQYQQPASRYYNNPYAMPPQNQYPYYDGDQYYVPPTYYGGSGRDNPVNSSANQKY